MLFPSPSTWKGVAELKILIPTAVVSGLVLLFLVTGLPIRATTTSENTTSLADLIPNFEKIYREALVRPHQEVAKKIYDEDIARYYNLLLHKTGLDIPLDDEK